MFFFFNAVCSKVIDPKKLDDLKKNIVVTLCQLEMYFLPSFFDIMVHLTVHLVRKIKLCALVFLKWMYQFERYMKIGMNLIFCVYMLSCSLFFRLNHYPLYVLISPCHCSWKQLSTKSNSLFLKSEGSKREQLSVFVLCWENNSLLSCSLCEL